MRPPEDKLSDLARLVRDTEPQEIDCGEMLNRLASFLQALREHSTLTETLRQVSQHLKVCPECREELVALVKAEGLDPASLLAE